MSSLVRLSRVREQHGAAPGISRKSSLEIVAWLLACAVLICVRMPHILGGRFWAEDGAVFYQKAWSLPWWQAAFSVHAGYLNFIGNLAGLAARYCLSIDAAPFAPILIALAIQLLPCAILACSHDSWLERRSFLALALLLIILHPFDNEVWLNTANSQTHLLLAGALVLAMESVSATSAWIGGLVLALSALSGPGTIALAPICAGRLLVDRSLNRLIQAAFLFGGLAIQALFVLSLGGGRSLQLDPGALLCAFFVKNILVPFSGSSAIVQAVKISQTFASGWIPGRVWLGVAAALLVSAIIFTKILARHPFRQATFWLVTAGFSTALVSYAGALHGPAFVIDAVGNARYAFASQSLFGLAFLAAAAPLAIWQNFAALAVVGWMLVVGEQTYFSPGFPTIANGPKWSAQVSDWRKDSDRVLDIWPNGWHLTLPVAAAQS